ncbi:hypothetical protein [Mycolicibacterium sphagni]|uniref:hypothetical protein n=1 Tax=Mycolicibacterium sphagni TaxID=1786 RepID=UPI0021F2FE22|nr:hypothetical protein [Mycolicibacterium sphagni]
MATIAVVLLPMTALILAGAAGYFKWRGASITVAQQGAVAAQQAATDGAIAMLSYQPDTVDKSLGAARERLTGPLRDSYGALTHDVVAPGARQMKVAAVATVPASAVISAAPDNVVALLFVDQSLTVDNAAPTSTASRVRVTMQKVEGRWLIAGFDPI